MNWPRNRIVAAARHQDVELPGCQLIGERHFVGWATGEVNIARLNPAWLLKDSANARPDPDAMPGSVAPENLHELVATASIVCQA